MIRRELEALIFHALHEARDHLELSIGGSSAEQVVTLQTLTDRIAGRIMEAYEGGTL